MSAAAATAAARNIRFKIKRQNAPGQASFWEEFDVPYQPNLNIISCLNYIAANPTNTTGKESTPVAWECSCLEEVCGACTMVINGKVRQSCSALIDRLVAEEGQDEIVLEPMAKFPVLRDLAVDRQRMFDGLIAVKAWVPIDGTHSLGAGPTETPDNQDVRYNLSRCMTCGCCLEACPQFQLDQPFMGAQVISQVRYFNMHKTGKTLANDRMEVMTSAGGIAECGNAQNCVEVCPKEIPLTESIAEIGRQATVYSLKQFFRGK
jgi:succinate dehydrogenase / fumarate reductase iron-sulfur subunit